MKNVLATVPSALDLIGTIDDVVECTEISKSYIDSISGRRLSGERICSRYSLSRGYVDRNGRPSGDLADGSQVYAPVAVLKVRSGSKRVSVNVLCR